MNKERKRLLHRIFGVLAVLIALAVIYLSALVLLGYRDYTPTDFLLSIFIVLLLSLSFYFSERKDAKALAIFGFIAIAIVALLYTLTYLVQKLSKNQPFAKIFEILASLSWLLGAIYTRTTISRP